VKYVLAVTGLVSFIVYVTYGLRNMLIVTEIVEAINQKLPPDRQFSENFWYPGKLTNVKAHYRNLCPEGDLLDRRRRIVTIGSVAGVIWIIQMITLAFIW
jgi:hypothetical protein